MEVDKLEVKKIIAQEIKPNENLIVWTDEYIKGIKKTFNEQIFEHNIEPETAKQRIIQYITDRLGTELRTD